MANPLLARDLPAQRAQTHIDDEGRFSGYASVFSVKDSGGDIVAPGAFQKSLAGRAAQDVRLLWQHDPREPIGVIEAIKEDARGLKVQGRLLLEIERAKALHLLIKAGALDALSIGYKVVNSVADRAQNARKITAIDLWEVSFVTFPMQSQARLIQVKTQPDTLRAFEALLRDAGGFSRRQAQRLAEKGFSGLAGDGATEEENAWREVMASLKACARSLNTH